jgi:hypothetical protein
VPFITCAVHTRLAAASSSLHAVLSYTFAFANAHTTSALLSPSKMLFVHVSLTDRNMSNAHVCRYAHNYSSILWADEASRIAKAHASSSADVPLFMFVNSTTHPWSAATCFHP